jgi:pyrroloquinoline-quinone synthase
MAATKSATGTESMTTLMPREEFFEALRKARAPKHGAAHPFSLAWSGRELTRAQLGQWATQHYYYIAMIPQQFGHLFCRLPDLDARQHLLENLLGEENPADMSKRHPDLLLDFAEACGRRRQDVVDAEKNGEILPSTRAMRAWIWEMVAFRDLAEAAAGIMVALEGQLPTLYPAYVTAMKKMGFRDDELEFFTVHIEGDEEHERVGFELAARYADTPELQRKALAIVEASVGMRWQLLDGIRALTAQAKVA